MGAKVVERKASRDGVNMALNDEDCDEGCYGDDHNLISNGNLANEEEEYDNDDSSYNGNQSQGMGIGRDVFWQSQQSLLQEILDHHGSTGLKMKQEIARLVEMAKDSNECVCPSPKSTSCCKCLRQRVVNALCNKGFCATIYTSKWMHTSKLQGGTHEYVEVVATTQSKQKQVHYIVELNFRDEFNMAKACDEYHSLIAQIPETYIGKYEHLNAIVRLLCDAAKRSAWEKRIHIGPWRKRNFMLKKWSNSQLQSQKIYREDEHLDEKSSTKEKNMPLVSFYLQFSPSASAVEAT